MRSSLLGTCFAAFRYWLGNLLSALANSTQSQCSDQLDRSASLFDAGLAECHANLGLRLPAGLERGSVIANSRRTAEATQYGDHGFVGV